MLDGLVDGEDDAGGFGGGGDSVDLDQGWLQHARLKVVRDALALDVDAIIRSVKLQKS